MSNKKYEQKRNLGKLFVLLPYLILLKKGDSSGNLLDVHFLKSNDINENDTEHSFSNTIDLITPI